MKRGVHILHIFLAYFAYWYISKEGVVLCLYILHLKRGCVYMHIMHISHICNIMHIVYILYALHIMAIAAYYKY
jgi:hypothetical protein